LVRAVQFARASEPMLDLVDQYARAKVAIDVGANEGLYTDRMYRVAAQVIAFEPIADLAASLQSRYPRARVEKCALSSSAGTRTLYVPYVSGRFLQTRASLDRSANPGMLSSEQLAPVRRLDDFAFDNVGLIKIDVEGHESDVLAGARATIARNRPALIVEIEERHHVGESARIVQALINLDYRLYFHRGGVLVEAGTLDFDELQPMAHAKAPFGKVDANYINNFLFVPTEQGPPVP
jgi:FkbM family methyltransferase